MNASNVFELGMIYGRVNSELRVKNVLYGVHAYIPGLDKIK